jgi:hypothetical protein
MEESNSQNIVTNKSRTEVGPKFFVSDCKSFLLISNEWQIAQWWKLYMQPTLKCNDQS